MMASVIWVVVAAPWLMTSGPPLSLSMSYIWTLALLDHRRDGFLDAFALLGFADVVEHHAGAEDHGDRVDDGWVEVFVLGGGAVRRLEDGHVVADVGATGETEAADQPAKPSETMSPNMLPATMTP